MREDSDPRESYERPQVVKVVVVREEMAVTGCKTARQVRGPTQGCQRSNCRAIGS